MVPEVTCASRGAQARQAMAAAIRAIMKLRRATLTIGFWDGRDMGSLLGKMLSANVGQIDYPRDVPHYVCDANHIAFENNRFS
jgi:hypothetical protein